MIQNNSVQSDKKAPSVPLMQFSDVEVSLGVAVLNSPALHKELVINYLTKIRDNEEELTSILEEAGLPFECTEMEAPQPATYVDITDIEDKTTESFFSTKAEDTLVKDTRVKSEYVNTKQNEYTPVHEQTNSQGPLTWIKENPGKTLAIVATISALVGVGYYVYSRKSHN